MPSCDIRRYQDLDGYVPFDAWLLTMTGPGRTQSLSAAIKIAAALQRLATEGQVRDGPRPHHCATVNWRSVSVAIQWHRAGCRSLRATTR